MCQHVVRGMRYNAENALYNGHKMLGYKVDETKHYIQDETTAPVVQRIFKQYADGKPLTEIADELDTQGIRTVHGRKFTVNSLRHKARTPSVETGDPRYWLTGKLYCGECGTTMHGMSGTSKTGKIHYYYACKNHRKHKCNLQNVSKDMLEAHVLWALRQLLEDTENLASLAVDVSAYYKELNSDNGYIKGLEAELENRKTALKEAIETEKLKRAIVDDEYSIQQYFDKYAHADFDDTEIRNTILEYFVDKIYVYGDRFVITWYYTKSGFEIDLGTLTEVTDINNIGKGGAVKSSILQQSAPLFAVRRDPLAGGCLIAMKGSPKLMRGKEGPKKVRN